MKIHLSPAKKWIISLFVLGWTVLFHYESLRYNYLRPWLGRELPKTKLLFPPAGWIMFYEVGESSGGAEIWAVKNDRIVKIDPHLVFATQWLGYDNIRRGILTHVLNPYRGAAFCQFLQRKFPHYDNFAIVQVYYPSVTTQKGKKFEQIVYKCFEKTQSRGMVEGVEG